MSSWRGRGRVVYGAIEPMMTLVMICCGNYSNHFFFCKNTYPTDCVIWLHVCDLFLLFVVVMEWDVSPEKVILILHHEIITFVSLYFEVGVGCMCIFCHLISEFNLWCDLVLHTNTITIASSSALFRYLMLIFWYASVAEGITLTTASSLCHHTGTSASNSELCRKQFKFKNCPMER